MQGFEPVTLTWQGTENTVPAERQMLLIAKIEDALIGDSGKQAISVLFAKEGPPHSRLAMAFGAALRHAGAAVSDDAVYLSIQDDIANKSKAQKAVAIQSAIIALLSIISPPAARALTGRDAADKPEKKA